MTTTAASSERLAGADLSHPRAGGGAPRTSRLRHFPALDGLRGVSFAMVFWGHADFFDGSGTSSVAMFLFFALSGFLITALLVSEHERHGTVSLRRKHSGPLDDLGRTVNIQVRSMTSGAHRT